MHMFKWDLLKILRDWKVRIILIALFLFIASFSTLYQNRSIELPLEETREQYDQTFAIFNVIPDEDFETETGQEIYDKLAEQQEILGNQRYILNQKEGNTVEGLEDIVSDYVEQGIIMTEHQLSFYEADDFESQELLISFIPSEEELEEDLRFLNYLQEENVEIDWNPMSPSLVLFNLVNLVSGVVTFIIAAILGADRFSRDQEHHWSITQGVPLSWSAQWRIRTLISWVLIWLAVIAGVFISYWINTLSSDSGTIRYPVSILGGDNAEYISILEYSLLVILLSMILSYIIVKLSTGLSFVFRNIYLTITLIIVIFYIPVILLQFPAMAEWNPLTYLQIQPLISGEYAISENISVPRIIINFIILYIILEIIFYFIFKLIPTRTGKLERRKN